MTKRAIIVTAYTGKDQTGYLGRAIVDLLEFSGTENQAVSNCVGALVSKFGDRMGSFRVTDVE